MRSRGIRNRLDDIAKELPTSRTRCALHGDLCQMGSRWPVTGDEVELHHLIRQARIAAGRPVAEPDPFTVNKHWAQSAQERQAAQELLAAAKAKVAADEALIIKGGNPE